MTRADEAVASARSRRWTAAPVVVGAGSIAIAQLAVGGWATGVTVFATVVAVVGGLAISLRISKRHTARHLPEGVEWRADAVVYGSELGPFVADAAKCPGPGVQVTGWLDVCVTGFAWTPRSRFAKRGAPAIRARWSDVSQVSGATASAAPLRDLIRADVLAFQLSDGRSVAAFVTSPGPVREALSRLGITITESSGPDR